MQYYDCMHLERSSSLRQWLPLVCIVLITLALYFPSLKNGFVNLDDPMLVYENSAVQTLSLKTIGYVFTSYDPELYIPLTFVSYQIEYALFGANPTAFHLTSLLLHLINVVLVFAVLELLLNKRAFALLGALLFAIHPINGEAVLWISARKDLLSTVFFLSAWLAYLKLSIGRKRTIIIGVLFVLALLSKVSAVTLPAILILTDWRKHRPLKESLQEHWPLLIIATMFIAIALGGKTVILAETTLFQKLLMAGISTVFTIGKILWPSGLSPLYPYHGIIAASAPAFWGSWLLIAAFAAIVLFSMSRTREVAFAFAFCDHSRAHIHQLLQRRIALHGFGPLCVSADDRAPAFADDRPESSLATRA